MIQDIAIRYHNVYGPLGTYDGGREKAPAAIPALDSAATIQAFPPA